MDPISMLMEFQLTRQEAGIYLTLLQEGRLTGYEAAKSTGISRSNVYAALASLTEKGAALMEEGASVKYEPVPVAQFCRNRTRRLEALSLELSAALPPPRPSEEGYLTVRGKENILEKGRALIEQANARVYLAAGEEGLRFLRPCLEDAVSRGLKVVILADPSLRLPGVTFYPSPKEPCHLRLITDSSRVLTGDLSDPSGCLYSGKKNLADLFKEAMKNEILLIGEPQ